MNAKPIAVAAGTGALILGAVFFSPVSAHADGHPDDDPNVTWLSSTTVNCDDETFTDTGLTVTVTPDGTVTDYSLTRGMLLDYEFAAKCPGLVWVYPSDEEIGNVVYQEGTLADGEVVPVPASPSHTHSLKPVGTTAKPQPPTVAAVPVLPKPAIVASTPMADPPKVGLYGDWKAM